MDIDNITKRHKDRLNNSSTNSNNSYLKNLFTRVLISIILVLSISIYIKHDSNNIEYINKYLSTESIPFTKINNLFKDNLGSVIPEYNKHDITVNKVDSLINLDYSTSGEYTSINTGINYMVNSLSGGLVVYKGNKDNLGNTVIIQGNDGVDIWYIGVVDSNINLYDYINKDSIIGNTEGEYLKLKLVKNGNTISYEEYIK